MKNKHKRIYIVLISLAVSTILSFFMTSCMGMPGGLINDDIKKEGSLIEIFEVKKGDISQNITATGVLDVRTSNEYVLKAQGKVLKSMEKGDDFLKGDLLVEADNSEALDALKEQEKNIESIEIDIKYAQSSLDTAKINYQKALDENHIAIQLAQLNEEKAQEITENALVSLENANRSAALSYQSSALALEHAEKMLQYASTEQESAKKDYDLESTELNLQSTEASNSASLDQAQGSYDKSIIEQSSAYWDNLKSTKTAQSQIALASENIKAAELKLEQAKIKLDLAKMTLDDIEESFEEYKIYAEYDGIVFSNQYKVGEYSDNTGGISVIGTDYVVRATISENDISKLSEGSETLLTLDAYKDKDFEGLISQIIPIALDDDGITSYEVLIDFKDIPVQELFYGLSANVSILSSQAKDVIYVPIQAVYKENGITYVDILTNIHATEEDIHQFVEKRQIWTGINDYYYIEVTSGLKEGEIILTSDI